MNQNHTIKNDLAFVKRICQTSSTLRKLTLTIEGQRQFFPPLSFVYSNYSRKNFLQNQTPLFQRFFSRLLKSPKFQYLREFQLKLKNGFNINKLDLDVNSKSRHSQFKMNILNNDDDDTKLRQRLISCVFINSKVTRFVTNYSSLQSSEQFVAKLQRLSTLDLDFSKTKEFKPDSYDLLTHLKKLKELNFNFSQNNFEDSTLQQRFFNKLPELKNIQGLSFDFSLSSHMTDSTKLLQFKQLCQLSQLQRLALNFDDCGQMTDSSLRYLSKPLAKLSNLKDFQINLSNLGRITSDGLGHITTALRDSPFNSLEILLKNCPKICSNSVERIAELLELKNSLQSLSLDFGGCKLISSRALQRIVSAISCQNDLESLRLSFRSLSGLEDESIRLMIEALLMLKKMKNVHLDFSYCSNITTASIENLNRCLKQNKQKFAHMNVDFYGCSEITTHEIQTFKQQLMNFTSI